MKIICHGGAGHTPKVQDGVDKAAEEGWNNVRYSEFVFPRDENAFRAVSQGREKFESFYAAPKTLKIGLNSQEKPYWSKVLTIPWPMEKQTLCESGSTRGALYRETAGNWYWDSTGELMHVDNGQYFFKSLMKCSLLLFISLIKPGSY